MAVPENDSVAGNTIALEATVTRADASTTTIADVVFDHSETDTVYLGDESGIPEAARGNRHCPAPWMIESQSRQLSTRYESGLASSRNQY